MAKISEAELKAQIKSGELSNVYMIYGEESYLKEFYVNKLKSVAVNSAFADFNYHYFDGKDASIDEILRDAQMFPMMSEYNCVLVHDYPLDKSSSDVDALKEFFTDVPDTTVLIFWFDSIDVDFKKSAKWKSVETAFAKAGSAVNLEKRTEADLAKLVVARAKKHNCSFDLQLAKYFISVVGTDINTVFNELDKICAKVSQGEITKTHVDTLATKCLQARVFDLSKFIIKGDSDNAFDILNTLFYQKEDPIAILSVISSCYVDLYRVKCAKLANEDEQSLAQYFNYKGKEFLIRNASRDCRNMSVSQLRRAIDALAETDELLKSSSIDKQILLEETVAKLINEVHNA